MEFYSVTEKGLYTPPSKTVVKILSKYSLFSPLKAKLNVFERGVWRYISTYPQYCNRKHI